MTDNFDIRSRTRLSPQRERVLNFIETHLRKYKRWPNKAEIARAMQWKTVKGVDDVLNALVCLGKIKVVERVPSGRGWIYTYDLNGDAA